MKVTKQLLIELIEAELGDVESEATPGKDEFRKELIDTANKIKQSQLDDEEILAINSILKIILNFAGGTTAGDRLTDINEYIKQKLGVK